MTANNAPRVSSERRARRFTDRSSHDGRPGGSRGDGNQRTAPVMGLAGEGPVRLASVPAPVATGEIDITIGWIARSPDAVVANGPPLDASHLGNTDPPARVVPEARPLITWMDGPHCPRGFIASSRGAFGTHVERPIGLGNRVGSPPDRGRACPW